jgi:hypothetical protein
MYLIFNCHDVVELEKFLMLYNKGLSEDAFNCF